MHSIASKVLEKREAEKREQEARQNEGFTFKVDPHLYLESCFVSYELVQPRLSRRARDLPPEAGDVGERLYISAMEQEVNFHMTCLSNWL